MLSLWACCVLAFVCSVVVRRKNNHELIVDVKENSISNTGLELVMQCKDTGCHFEFGEEAVLVEEYKNGQWQEVDLVNEDPYGTYADLHYVSAENTLEYKVNWSSIYGKLPSGKYRIIKVVDTIARDESKERYCVYLEFSL